LLCIGRSATVAGVIDRGGEVEAAVAVRALAEDAGAEVGVEEQHLAALGRGGDGVVVEAEGIAIVRRVAGDQRALERRDRLGDRVERERIVDVRERLGEHALIAHVGAQASEELVLLAGEAELDRVLAEHRNERLGLEREQAGVRPRQRAGVGDVGQRHRAARMGLAGRAHRVRQAVGEGA
jgi:hypothetical protein